MQLATTFPGNILFFILTHNATTFQHKK